jgi:uncharacterized membrane protein YfcA
MPVLQDILSSASGSLVGFTLGLVVGGGSILALPLIVYVVGAASTHIAIGTSAVAVAASAAANLAGHARAGTVKWRCAAVFAAAGIAGAAGGAELGKRVDGGRLLLMFGMLMVAIGLLTLRPRRDPGNPDIHLDRSSAARLLPLLIGYGFAVGALSGFFGIGGGFLIVPGLMAATGMPMINAVGSSLVSVAAFGLTTATSYSLAGLVDWRMAALFVAGGALGGLAGTALGRSLSQHKRALSLTFSAIVVTAGAYMVVRSLA